MVEETGVPLKDIKAQKVVMTLKDLYGLKIADNPEVKSSSVDTSVWKVDFDNGSSYAKFYLTNDYSLALTQDEVSYYNFLLSHGVNVPFVYPAKNGEKVQSLVIDELDLAMFLMKYEELTVLSLESITREEMIKVAKAIAKMSKVAMDYSNKFNIPIEKVSDVPKDLIDNLLVSPNKSEFNDQEIEKIIASYKAVQEYLKQNPINFEELTKTVLHSDLMLNHTPLLPNGEVYFFDFADRWFGPVVWDLAIMLNNLYRGGVISVERWEELQRWFFEGYTPEIELTQSDYKVLKSLMMIHCARGTNYLNQSAIKLGRPDGTKGIRKSWIIVDYLLQENSHV